MQLHRYGAIAILLGSLAVSATAAAAPAKSTSHAATAEKKQPAKKPAAKKPAAKKAGHSWKTEVFGTVVAVDAARGTITLRQRPPKERAARDFVYSFAPHARLMEKRAQIAPSALRAGERVRGNAEITARQNTLFTLEVLGH
jgi:hypothetical protein